MRIGKVEVVKFNRGRHVKVTYLPISKSHIFSIRAFKNSKHLFAAIREWLQDYAQPPVVCKNCGKSYYVGKENHKYLCWDCSHKAATIAKEGVGAVGDFSVADRMFAQKLGVSDADIPKYAKNVMELVVADRQKLVDILKEDEDWCADNWLLIGK